MIKKFELKNDVYAGLFGSFDENAKEIERAFGIRIMTADGGLQLIGSQSGIEWAQTLIENAVKVIESGGSVDKDKMSRFIELVKEGRSEEILPLEKDVKVVTAGGRKIKCLTAGQRDYAAAIEEHTLTFAIGPAGSGKTYLAVAAAVTSFRRGDVKRIVLTRPALEAGERLGFLPGDLKEKVDPYLTPLYDALKEMFGSENCAKLTERGAIEVAPLAYMRGRTLNEAFIILDEAQNTTREQMRMFLTRMGNGSKTVVTGDITQIDLQDKQSSGLVEAVRVLDGVDDIAVCRLKGSDVVRSPIVRKILKAYEEAGKMPPTDDKNNLA
ncbi:MAG: PhoH family protein [Clostridia bacterium]|jgi:phosphate starvation-inducible PhoH-like protein|nr:PhoH family protein [Clostridia bacterium]